MSTERTVGSRCLADRNHAPRGRARVVRTGRGTWRARGRAPQALGHALESGAGRRRRSTRRAAPVPAGVWRLRLLVSGRRRPGGGVRPVHARTRSRVARRGRRRNRWRRATRSCATRRRYREVYNRARTARPDVDDVLLVNERGEITEVDDRQRRRRDRRRAGHAAARVRAAAGRVPRGAARRRRGPGARDHRRPTSRSATRLWLINSLREWIPAVLIGQV